MQPQLTPTAKGKTVFNCIYASLLLNQGCGPFPYDMRHFVAISLMDFSL